MKKSTWLIILIGGGAALLLLWSMLKNKSATGNQILPGASKPESNIWDFLTANAEGFFSWQQSKDSDKLTNPNSSDLPSTLNSEDYQLQF